MNNFTVVEAVKIIQEGKPVADVKDITQAYPEFALAVAKNDLLAFASITGLNVYLGPAKAAGDTKTENKKTEKADTKPAKEDDGGNLEDKTVKELIEMCDERGISCARAGKNKQYYIKKLAEGSADAKAAGKQEDEAWGDEPEAKDPYDGKGAKELYTMCKERGIKAEIKKPAKYYADLLKEDDKEAADEGDGWGDGDTNQDDGDDWNI